MSYCVNCGVELEQSERQCPLCGVEVINPKQPHRDIAPRPYPERLDPINARLNKRFAATIISIAIAFPAVLTLVINYIYKGSAGWGAYVASSLVLLWFFIVPLFLWTRLTFLKAVLPGLFALAAYFRYLEHLHPGNGWFMRLALPITALTALFVIVIGLLIERRILKSYYAAAAVFVAVAIIVVAVEYLSEIYAFGSVKLQWSLYAAIPSLAAAALSLAVARRRSWRDRVNRRIHI